MRWGCAFVVEWVSLAGQAWGTDALEGLCEGDLAWFTGWLPACISTALHLPRVSSNHKGSQGAKDLRDLLVSIASRRDCILVHATYPITINPTNHSSGLQKMIYSGLSAAAPFTPISLPSQASPGRKEKIMEGAKIREAGPTLPWKHESRRITWWIRPGATCPTTFDQLCFILQKQMANAGPTLPAFCNGDHWQVRDLRRHFAASGGKRHGSRNVSNDKWLWSSLFLLLMSLRSISSIRMILLAKYEWSYLHRFAATEMNRNPTWKRAISENHVVYVSL